MTAAFDPNSYWINRGRSYRSETRLNGAFYRAQEQLIVDTIRAVAPLNAGILLEVGCGFGRVTKVLADQFPYSISAVDLSDDQIIAAREYCISERATFSQHDLYSENLLPRADIAIAIEVFIHHPAEALADVIGKLLAAVPILIHEVDENVTVGDTTAEHCFIHDYDGLYRSLGCDVRKFRASGQAIWVVSLAA